MRLSSAQSSSGTVGGHDVDGVDAADDTRPVVSALAIAHAGGAEVGHDSKVLPDGKPCLVDFLANDRICLAQRLETVAGNSAEAANAQARAGEGLALDHARGRPHAPRPYTAA